MSELNIKEKCIRDIGFHEKGTLVKVQRATRSVYFMYLHYRIINRIIATNTYLYNIKISNDKKCTFCRQDNETIAHLFWKCPVTQTFLKQIDNEPYAKYKIHFKHNEHARFFLHELNDLLQILLITITKAVIYGARNDGKKPTISRMMNTIKIEAEKDDHASKLNNKTENFANKWKSLKKIIS